jgi:hypothetical protein
MYSYCQLLIWTINVKVCSLKLAAVRVLSSRLAAEKTETKLRACLTNTWLSSNTICRQTETSAHWSSPCPTPSLRSMLTLSCHVYLGLHVVSLIQVFRLKCCTHFRHLPCVLVHTQCVSIAKNHWRELIVTQITERFVCQRLILWTKVKCWLSHLFF